MVDLFLRTWRVEIAGLSVSDLDLDFKITRSIRREPNTLELTVYNLAESSRSRIAEEPRAAVTVRAGYRSQGDPPPVLFSGTARRVATSTDGLEIVTEITARDAGDEYQTARISRSYGPDTSVSRVLTDAIDAMGIGRGNVAEVAGALTLSNGASAFGDGYVAHGPAARVVDDIVRGAGLRWSVQNGAFQALRRGSPLQTRAVLLGRSSGLLGSPSRDETDTVTARALIQPGLDPGRRVVLESATVRGAFEIRKIEVEGSTHGDAWDATLELRPLS